MIQVKTVWKLVDYILQNSDSATLPGLYNGKAGLSLSLFMASRYLEDESIGNKAYYLLKESLVTKSRDLSFENGLAGIGYVLLYLIDNHFIETDFDEIFGRQCEEIIQNIENIENDPRLLLSSLKVIYFLVELRKIKEDKRIHKIIIKIFEGIELYLLLQFFNFSDKRYMNNKQNILGEFEKYLNLSNYSGYPDFSISLLESYAQLYRNGKLASNYLTGYFFGNILKKKDVKYKDIIQDNKIYGLFNIHQESLYLYEQIDLFSILASDADPCERKHELIQKMAKEWRDLISANIEYKISPYIPQHSLNVGYGFGLSRLLAFATNDKYLIV